MKEKTYKFSHEGLQKAFADSKQEKIDMGTKIFVWLVIFGLYGYGTITTSGIIKMVACNGTSKIVKYFMA